MVAQQLLVELGKTSLKQPHFHIAAWFLKLVMQCETLAISDP